MSHTGNLELGADTERSTSSFGLTNGFKNPLQVAFEVESPLVELKIYD